MGGLFSNLSNLQNTGSTRSSSFWPIFANPESRGTGNIFYNGGLFGNLSGLGRGANIATHNPNNVLAQKHIPNPNNPNNIVMTDNRQALANNPTNALRAVTKDASQQQYNSLASILGRQLSSPEMSMVRNFGASNAQTFLSANQGDTVDSNKFNVDNMPKLRDILMNNNNYTTYGDALQRYNTAYNQGLIY